MKNTPPLSILLIISNLLYIDIAAVAQENVPEIIFTEQPQNMCIQKGEAFTLRCTATANDDEVYYCWYKIDQEGTTQLSESWTTMPDFEVEPFTEKGIRYYICGASTNKIDVVYSDKVAVAYTGLPTIVIETVDGEEPTAEYVYPPSGAYGRGLANATKVPAKMQIFDAEGSEVYNSGEYVAKESGLTIKLRGNTSANLNGKSPYKIKLQKKADLLASLLGRNDKQYNDKEWILLKDATSLNTFVGWAVTSIAGAQWTPQYVYANVVINNNYRGAYMLTEAISRGEKRIDISKEGYIIERDAYWWNEDVKFITSKYNQKYTFKYPDEDDIVDNPELLTYIEEYMNTLEQHVADGTYEDYIDVESFARWLLTHDILGTWDAGGSNAYMQKYDNTDESKIYMSTLWDFDSNYWQKDIWANQHNGTRIYAAPLFQSSNRAFVESYVAQWQMLKDNVWPQLSVQLQNLETEIGDNIDIARELDATRWKTTYSTVTQNIATAEEWFVSRNTWLDNAINQSHYIDYELNGGRFDDDNYPTEFGFDEIVKFTNPVKDNAKFLGWTYSGRTSPKTDLTIYGYTYYSDLTLTANWEEVVPIVTDAKIVTSQNTVDSWFDLSGKRLYGKPTKRGVYIHNNRLECVK